MQRSDYLIRKIIFAIATLLVVIIFNFFLFRILPGDPVKLIIHSPRMTAETQERIRVNFGLDKPVWFNKEGYQEGGLKGAFDTQFTAYCPQPVQRRPGRFFFHAQGCHRTAQRTRLADRRAGRSG